MDGVDDFGCLLDEFLAGHILHRQLLDLGRRRLLRLARSAAPVAVEHAARLDCIELYRKKLMLYAEYAE